LIEVSRIVFVIRHKATGKFMPLFRRNKGYSHWNPSNTEKKAHQETNHIRVFSNLVAAKIAYRSWFITQNAEFAGYTTTDGEDDYTTIDKKDDRKQEDIEIVEAELVIKK